MKENLELVTSTEQLKALCDQDRYIPGKAIEPALKEDGSDLALCWALYGSYRYFVTVCPKCGSLGAFPWAFLGKLRDPVCGTDFFVSNGEYLLWKYSRMTRGAYGGSNAAYALFIGWWLETPFILTGLLLRSVIK